MIQWLQVETHDQRIEGQFPAPSAFISDLVVVRRSSSPIPCGIELKISTVLAGINIGCGLSTLDSAVLYRGCLSALKDKIGQALCVNLEISFCQPSREEPIQSYLPTHAIINLQQGDIAPDQISHKLSLGSLFLIFLLCILKNSKISRVFVFQEVLPVQLSFWGFITLLVQFLVYYFIDDNKVIKKIYDFVLAIVKNVIVTHKRHFHSKFTAVSLKVTFKVNFLPHFTCSHLTDPKSSLFPRLS